MSPFTRELQLARASQASGVASVWDMLVIGGGATGVGIALDAASRGYAVCLLEQADFGKGTSSRSTKLVHGGVRYLQQGNLALVREALRERALLLNNAPHVVHDCPFVIPCASLWQAFFYGTGLKLYDLLAGRDNLAASHGLSQASVLACVPTLRPARCAAGIIYHDGQFDDTRLLINMAQTAHQHHACLVNYARVTDLLKDSNGQVVGVRWLDVESQQAYETRARVVINATGPFCDSVRRLDEPTVAPMVAASQGIHLVLPKRFLPGDTAIIVPKTSDGRVVFLIPWLGHAVLGTTDTPIERISLDPQPQAQEIEFLLKTANEYLAETIAPSDILSVFTGIRPLVVAGANKSTARLPRDHSISVSSTGLITITGGKWTTYRKMAEDCVNRAAQQAGLTPASCVTAQLRLSGAGDHASKFAAGHHYSVYGCDRVELENLERIDPRCAELLHDSLPIRASQVIWGVRREMARTVEDLLARRTRALFLNARAAVQMAPRVAELMASELGFDVAWQARQIDEFCATARLFTP